MVAVLGAFTEPAKALKSFLTISMQSVMFSRLRARKTGTPK